MIQVCGCGETLRVLTSAGPRNLGAEPLGACRRCGRLPDFTKFSLDVRPV